MINKSSLQGIRCANGIYFVHRFYINVFDDKFCCYWWPWLIIDLQVVLVKTSSYNYPNEEQILLQSAQHHRISLINPNMYLLEEEHLTNIFFKQIVVIEGSNRLGGWIQSERLQDGTVFEGGPRSFRFGGKVEAKTLELVSNTQ